MEKTDTSTPPALHSATPDGPNYLAAFLLTLFLGYVGTNRLYTGHTALGWWRLVLFASIFIAPAFFLLDMTAGIIAIVLGAIGSSGAMIWWYIDIWQYYLGEITDKKTGKPLVKNSPRDYIYAKSMMISFHAAIILGIILIMVGIGLLITAITSSPLLQDGLYPGTDIQQLQEQLQDLQ